METPLNERETSTKQKTVLRKTAAKKLRKSKVTNNNKSEGVYRDGPTERY